MMSLPSRTRVFVLGSSFPGLAGSGICFTQTTTFMVRILPDKAGVQPTSPNHGSSVRGLVRTLLVVNAAASSVTARGRVVIQKALSADHDVTTVETNRRGHASRLAQGAAAQGFDLVVALGGDGTLNEVANGLAGTQTALGVLPGGS